MLEYLVIIGPIIQLIGISFYIKDTIKGDNKPNRVSWLMWSIAPIITVFAALSEGVRWSVLPTFMTGFGPFLVFLSTFANKKSYWKLVKFDYICGLLSIVGLILWAITSNALLAIFFAILSDFAAGIPTLLKSWKDPDSESIAPFSTGVINMLTTFFAIKSWGFAEIAFPIYLILMNIAIILVILRKKIFKGSNKI